MLNMHWQSSKILRRRIVKGYCIMKVVVFFGIFGTICAMVLLISPERIELESCACAQIEALDE